MLYLSEWVDGKQVKRSVEKPRFSAEADIIVCGLGTAGSLVALFAAENGLSVLGVEAFTSVGGMHAAGGVQHHYFGFPGGRYETMELAVEEFAQRYTCTRSEGRKLCMEQALISQGVTLMYEARACGVYLEDHRVVGLQVLTNDGIVSCAAKIVMDCTAEACVAVMAGCQTEAGRYVDGQMQPYSIVSLVQNGETYGYTNVDYGRVNPYDPVDYSRSILFSRGYEITEGHKGKTPIAQTPMIGIREGRRIVPEEGVTLPDLFAGKKTRTPMFYAYADLDKHGWDIAYDGQVLGDWAIGSNLGAYNVTVAVPYQAILPKGYEGLLVPCRALGVDRDIASCVRMIPDMKKLAEAAADWASLAIGQSLSLREVPYRQLKAGLEESGCLNRSYDCDYRVDGKWDWDKGVLQKKDVHWITDPAKLEEILKTDKPGEAIWSAGILGEKAISQLKKLLTSEEENTRKHAAFALAMTGSGAGLPILREMVRSRDGVMLKDCRKNNNLRGCMAIYWLGRLGDGQIARELMDLICDPEELQKPVYHDSKVKTTRYDISDFEGIYFQFITQTVMALIRIGDANPSLRREIATAFSDAFAGEGFYYRITKRPPLSSEGNMVLQTKSIALAASKKWGF